MMVLLARGRSYTNNEYNLLTSSLSLYDEKVFTQSIYRYKYEPAETSICLLKKKKLDNGFTIFEVVRLISVESLFQNFGTNDFQVIFDLYDRNIAIKDILE